MSHASSHLLLGFLAVLSACTEQSSHPTGTTLPAATGEIPDAEFTPGSRLRPIFVTVGGAKVFERWFDTKLEMPCEFHDSEEGVVCAPYGGDADLSLGYADDDCERPALIWDNARGPIAGATYYSRWGSADGCEEGRLFGRLEELYKRGPQIANPSAFSGWDPFYEDCPGYPGEEDTLEAYEFSTVPIAGTLVAQTRLRIAGSGALRATYREASDGSIERIGWYDASLGQACSVTDDGTGLPRCLPLGRARVERAWPAGSECRNFSGDRCGDEYAVEVVNTDGCRPQINLLKFGARVSSPVTPPNVCYFDADDRNERQVSLVDPALFPKMREQPAKSRIDPFVKSAEGLPDFTAHQELRPDPSDPVEPARPFRDSSLQITCRLQIATDGVRRCLPDQTGDDVLFRDAQCTQPVLAWKPSPCPNAPEVPAYVRLQERPPTAYRVGPKLPADVPLYNALGADCLSVRGPFKGTVYEVEVAKPETFAEAVSKVQSD